MNLKPVNERKCKNKGKKILEGGSSRTAQSLLVSEQKVAADVKIQQTSRADCRNQILKKIMEVLVFSDQFNCTLYISI